MRLKGARVGEKVEGKRKNPCRKGEGGRKMVIKWKERLKERKIKRVGKDKNGKEQVGEEEEGK